MSTITRNQTRKHQPELDTRCGGRVASVVLTVVLNLLAR